jgi:hypothetical protein
MANDINARDMIQSKLAEGVVTYSEYDVNGRLVKVTEAPIYVRHLDPCLVTELKYNGVTTNVQATKEYVGTWNSANHFDNL